MHTIVKHVNFTEVGNLSVPRRVRKENRQGMVRKFNLLEIIQNPIGSPKQELHKSQSLLFHSLSILQNYYRPVQRYKHGFSKDENDLGIHHRHW